MLEATTHGPITRINMARTFFGRPLYTTSAYLVDGLLIDTGCPATAAELVAWCRDREIRQVINTHHHEDHSGGNRLLQQALGLPVAAPGAAVPILADFPRLHFYRRLAWQQPKNVTVDPLGAVVETERYRLEVIPTPGHCGDHVSLFEREQGWLFSGDLFIHERVRYLRSDEMALTTIQSLRHVLTLAPRLLICAHAGVVTDGSGALARKIAFWTELAEAAQALRGEGYALPEITERLLGPEDYMVWFTQGHFSKRNLIRSLVLDH